MPTKFPTPSSFRRDQNLTPAPKAVYPTRRNLFDPNAPTYSSESGAEGYYGTPQQRANDYWMEKVYGNREFNVPKGYLRTQEARAEDKFVSGTPAWLKALISKVSKDTGLSTLLLSAQIKQESSFKSDAGSIAGARGLAQFIPSTARMYGLRVDDQVDERLDPEKSVQAMGRYMRDLIRQYGSTERALSAYNSGNPERYKDPNFKTWYGSKGETYKYVKNIMANSGLAKPVKPASPTPEPFIPEVSSDIISPVEVYRKPKVLSPVPASELPPQRISMSLVKPAMAAEKLPTPSSVSGQFSPRNYTVKSGDTLWGIANKLGIGGQNWQKLGYQGNPRQLPIGYQFNF